MAAIANPATTLPTQPAQSSPRPRALTELGLNTLLSPEQSASSDDERDGHGFPEQEEEAGAVIGVSIGREQTRLSSPATPAIEKAAAMRDAGGFFENAFANEHMAEEELEEKDQEEKEQEDITPPAPVTHEPSPAPSEQQRSTQSRSILRDSFLFGRRRSSTGPNTTLEKLEKVFKSGLPKSLSRTTLSTANNSSSNVSSRTMNTPLTSDSKTAQQDFALPSHSRSASGGTGKPSSRPTPITTRSDDEAKATVGKLPSRPPLAPLRTRTSQLRRSASDGSFAAVRSASIAPSLGDDSRFEDVSEQVNSRFKALKDSFQDSSIKFPAFSNLSISDFIRERSGSLSRKGPDLMTSTVKPVDAMTRQPYHNAKAAVSDATKEKHLTHPYLHAAMDELEGDLVILGGYRGSILRSTEPPNRQLWVPIKVGLNIRKVDLEVGVNEEDDDKAADNIFSSGMLTHIGPVDISRRLFKRLRACDNAQEGKLRVHDYGYDWRLHPTFLSKQLVQFLEGLPCNAPNVPPRDRGAIVIAHSLGGLITRHAVNSRPELFKGVIYAGVPQTCVNILGPLRNGDEVLFSSRVLTAQVNFSIRTSYALLPLDGRCFIDKDTNEEYPVDFFDPQTWTDYCLSPCVARPLPPLQPPPTKSTGLTGYVSSVTHAFPLRNRKHSLNSSTNPIDPTQTVAPTLSDADDPGPSAEPPIPDSSTPDPNAASPRTAVTLPPETAQAYLTRTLASVKIFKQNLDHNLAHATANVYPPVAAIYGKSIPTVYGAKVRGGRAGIRRSDAYDDLAFASGDGVVLARAAMLPPGYRAAKGGVVSSERGHVTLLGDLEAVGRCLRAVMRERRKGVGLGRETKSLAK